MGTMEGREEPTTYTQAQPQACCHTEHKRRTGQRTEVDQTGRASALPGWSAEEVAFEVEVEGSSGQRWSLGRKTFQKEGKAGRDKAHPV